MSSKAKAPATKLIVLSAPSGTGKSTLASMLLEKHPARIKLSVSSTTRPPRGDEKHGEHYFFVSEEEFKKMIKDGHFLEYAHVFGKYWYGTSKKNVEMLLTKANVLFDIDVQGAKSLKKVYGKRCVTIFILPPSFEELEQRLRNRKTESAEAIATRLKTARAEMKEAPDFDHQLTNHDLETTYRELEKIVANEAAL